MTLVESIIAAGMTPPRAFIEGRWLRFPGVGKKRGNKSGWCRVISPTMAIFGDWSSGVRVVWKDDAHLDDERSRQALRDAQKRERSFAQEQRAKQSLVALQAQEMVDRAVPATHAYLARKGFPMLHGLVLDGKLLIPMMDFGRYPAVISAQLIDESGEKKFLYGGRAKGAVHRLGVAATKARRVVLCEGYATGLTLEAALRKLPGAYSVIVCFSASNLEHVASLLPESMPALIAADNDTPNKLTGLKAGEEAAKRTGRTWIMPSVIGTDYNDLHAANGLMAVVEALRTV